MSSTVPGAVKRPRRPKRRIGGHGWVAPGLLILPTVVVIGVFVYGLIGSNINTSLQDRHNIGPSQGFAGLDDYRDLFTDDDFIYSLRNLLLYTAAFLVGTLCLGFPWAWLLERKARGESLFRATYLFPMAVSFVASGVVWRWLLNNAEGDRASGLNRLFDTLHLDFLQNPWWTDERWGILAIAVPAIWQLSGYVMALLPGRLPRDPREAARGGPDGRRRGVAALPPRHLPAAEPGRPLGDHHRPHVAEGLRPDHGHRGARPTTRRRCRPPRCGSSSPAATTPSRPPSAPSCS